MFNINYFTSSFHIFLIAGLVPVFSQFIGPTHVSPHVDPRNRQLSVQQQGHILSDIQQNHRFRFQNNPQPTVQSNQPSVNPTQNWQSFQNFPQFASTPRPVPPPVANEFSNFDPYTFNFQTEKPDPEKEKQRLKELKEKQAIIEKHNQFVERQYEKALKKAQEDHDEFLRKQREQGRKLNHKIHKISRNSPIFSQSGPRFIYPEETNLFDRAVKKYYELHPTTTTTTTTTTTPEPEEYEDEDFEIKSKSKDESLLIGGNIKNIKKLEIKDTKTNDLSGSNEMAASSNTVKYIQSIDDLEALKQQYKSQKINRDDLLTQIRLAIGGNPEDAFEKNETTREISLPGGEKVQIIKTNNPNLLQSGSLNHILLQHPSGSTTTTTTTTTTSTTSRPPSEIIKEITSGVLPPGVDYDLLRTSENGSLEKINNPGNLSGERKITFVLLEEQDDGSFKVQGVKGGEKENIDVDSVLKKIKEGEIKIPQPIKPTVSASTTANVIRKEVVTSTPVTEIFRPTVPTTESTRTPLVSILPNAFALSSNDDVSLPIASTSKTLQKIYTSTPSGVNYNKYATSAKKHSSPSEILLRSNTHSFQDLQYTASTASSHNPATISKGLSFGISSTSAPDILGYTPAEKTTSIKRQSSVLEAEEINKPTESKTTSTDFPDILRKNSLHAMARFLKQSGLDTILNETGPYTVFVPSDDAFKQLLIQLGGPEKAEEKFKENPRLLSGLLLHHVIPGAFTLESLQDEMTGVSLAGTQLRVNQYNMHDDEWNDIKVTTINGAEVLKDKNNIRIPQGIAHAIDKVMFPLPVGDLMQTLQSDRERRFTQFLKALYASNVAESLQGSKVYTVFAPTDKAFATLPKEEVSKIISDKTLAKEFVLRHIIPGSLYTHGMRYYQVKDSLLSDKQITITKNSGKVKVNNHSLNLQNIPATNGVIHAMDYLL